MQSSRRIDHRRAPYPLGLCVVSALLSAAAGLRCADESEGDALNQGCSALDARMRECGLLTGGRFYCDNEDWLAAQRGERDEIGCQYQCYAGAACGATKDWVCGLQTNTTEADQLQLSECLSGCAMQYGLACEAAAGAAAPVSSRASCDGRSDCVDGADELDCDSFACGDGQVVARSAVCDGSFQCTNRRDERANCPFFTCGDGFTLPFEVVCDGFEDCPDGNDERGCSEPSDPLFLDCTCGAPGHTPCSDL
jgi:hypothetical protein